MTSRSFVKFVILGYLFVTALGFSPSNTSPPPPVSRATNLPNFCWTWRNHQVRYQVAYPSDKSVSSKGSAILVHGLFVNSDHWRKTLKGLADEGYTAYALDLMGSGYSSKPSPRCEKSREILCGELRYFQDKEEYKYNIALGTADGGTRIVDRQELKHPCDSPYNFYTWSQQVNDFAKEIVKKESDEPVTLVSNSIGTITCLQSVLDCDCPTLYNGLFCINPNFRELHSAEVPFSNISMPIVRAIQATLRSNGQILFDALAKPNTVKQILMEPYHVSEAVDDELVDVLLTPLLTPGASDVVFDTLSYSSGPLPEQQLSEESFPESCPVRICYGAKDPWTPSARVDKLKDLKSVESVIRLEGAGHCPMDETPELVNPLLIDFMRMVRSNNNVQNKESTSLEKPFFVQ
jgi:pimeloyl-ACP methyl ester carboxylesterase